MTRKWPLDSRDVYFLDGLRPRSRYSFRFAAENRVGIGDWSIERELWTDKESRPERPEFRNLPVEPLSKQVVSPFADQFAVSWTLPPDNGRRIRFFELKLFEVSESLSLSDL